MNVAHHSVYPVWLEISRTELLRSQGVAYRDLEHRGVLFVVARMNIRYRRPALYDDELDVHVRTERLSTVQIEHAYEIRRNEELLSTAQTTLVCVNRDGRPLRIPKDVFG